MAVFIKKFNLFGQRTYPLSRIVTFKKSFLCLALLAGLAFPSQRAFGLEPGDMAQIGLAFLTSLAIHESGHFLMADSLNAHGNTLNFFTRRKGSFFLGLSTYSEMEEEGKLPYHLAGEIAASHTFEYALSRHRTNPTPYHNALLFFSATDFLFYSLYAFYLNPVQDDHFDPVSISKDTGLNHGTILSIAFTQTLLNSYRVVSGKDRIVPYFDFDNEFASFNIKFNF